MSRSSPRSDWSRSGTYRQSVYVGTCVHGEPAQALQTALRRLTSYLNGDNRGGAILRAERPVIQQQLGAAAMADQLAVADGHG